jgi:uncharacterized membrane protein
VGTNAKSRDEIGQKRSKIYALSFPIIFFVLGNDTLGNVTVKKNDTSKTKPSDRNVSISIDNGTSNRKHRNREWTYMQHVRNQMSDQQSNRNITTLYAHTITNHLSQTTTKFCRQQVSVTAANLPARLLATVVSACWGMRVRTEVIYVGLYYWTMLGLGVT